MRLEQGKKGVYVRILQPWGDHPLSIIPIEMKDSQWEEYYNSTLRIDSRPISLMAIDLDEAISMAMNTGMRDVKIVYTGMFDVSGRYYTDPQT